MSHRSIRQAQTLLLSIFVAVSAMTILTAAPAHAQGSAGNEDPAVNLLRANPTGNFNATGTISSLTFVNGTDPQYVIAGNWSLTALNGNVTDFSANFTMAALNGTQRHQHSITNFESNVVAPLLLDRHGTLFTGISDITTNGSLNWPSVQTTVSIAKHDVIKITLDNEAANNHFQGQPIYGVMFSLLEYEPLPAP